MISAFLLMGSTEMAGRGIISSVPVVDDDRILMQRNGLWLKMVEPVIYDGPEAGAGLSPFFTKEYLCDHENEFVGLIPAASSYTNLNEWAAGGMLFENAVYCAKLAERTSTIKAILWYQGAKDGANLLDSKNYSEKLIDIFKHMRNRLSDLPIVLGELINESTKEAPFGHIINNQIHRVTQCIDNAIVATAEGIRSEPESMNIDTKSLRILGIRFYKAYKELVGE